MSRFAFDWLPQLNVLGHQCFDFSHRIDYTSSSGASADIDSNVVVSMSIYTIVSR